MPHAAKYESLIFLFKNLLILIILIESLMLLKIKNIINIRSNGKLFNIY